MKPCQFQNALNLSSSKEGHLIVKRPLSNPSSKSQDLQLRFRRNLRLRSRFEFQRVVRQGERRVGKFLCVDCLRSEKSRLGISASAKYGTAPERNRFKRLVREAFRKSHHRSFPCFELNVIPRQRAKHATGPEVMDELIRLLSASA